MDNSRLLDAVTDVLRQGRGFLDHVSPEKYCDPSLMQSPACSLGAHYRHVLDHFQCLLEGVGTGHVNYDRRRRDPLVENSLTRAQEVTETLIQEFRGLRREVLIQTCTMASSVNYSAGDALPVGSTIAREVVFCVGHAIHHYAILKMLCSGSGIVLSDEFGIAPSTLKHLEIQTAPGVR